MAKTSKKKRNKPYRGEDATVSDAPVVRHYAAVQRNPLSQWWYDNKKIAKPIGVAAGAIVIFIWLLVEAIQIVF